jgi:GNAT superfamily N-acetyltransferase
VTAADTAVQPAMRYRPAAPDDLATCAGIWREAINDYIGRLGQPEVPDDLNAILRLYAHLQATDPGRFVVAVDPASAEIVAFAAAVDRGPLWFLSMLFVRPGAQARGLGKALLSRVLPDGSAGEARFRATATDSAQPISNGLYGSLGIVARTPLFRLVGLVGDRERDGLPALPSGVTAIRFDEIDSVGPAAGERDDGLGSAALRGELDDIDLEVAGFEHPADHAWLRTESRLGYLYRGPDGAMLGYGYTSEAGRVGPVAVRDAALLGAVVAHLVTAIEPRGAFGIWVPGAADAAMVPLLRAGLRIDGFPVLLCWDRPFADFGRYLPISPGLL